MTERERELIAKGVAAEQRERAELIDNCYRAGALLTYTDVPHSIEELRRLYRTRLTVLGYVAENS